MSKSILFTPTKLGEIELRNRVVMAPLTRSRADKMGVPPPFAADYYSQRASAGLIITEATQVSFQGMGYPRTPGVHTQAQIARWRTIAEAVHQKGGRIVMQLWHVGRIANRLNRGVAADTVSASAVTAAGQIYTDETGMQNHDAPRSLTADEIATIADDFAAGAANAIGAGFDGVEFHSANGYLAHQFLSSNVNTRTDQYGGSIPNRVRMPLQVLQAIVSRVPASRVGIRLSPGHAFNDIREDDTADLYAHYARELDKIGLAYVHVQRPYANAVEDDIAGMVRTHFSGPLLVCGGYDAASGAHLIASGQADAVAFGRAFIANPDLVERIKTGAMLTDPDQATFYTPGEAGYTDYPLLKAA